MDTDLHDAKNKKHTWVKINMAGMHNFKIKCSVETLYKCFICILVFMYMIEATSWKAFSDSIFHEVLQIMAVIMAATYIVVRKYTLKELFRIGLLNTIGVLCFLSSGYTGLLMTMLAITLLPRGALDRVLHMILVEETVVFVGIVLAAQIGILSNEVVEINKSTYMAEAMTLGFDHPNMLAAQATSIILLFLCVNRKKLKKRYILGALITIIINFFFSRGRTSLLLGLMAVVMIAIRKKRWLNKVQSVVLPWMYIIVFLILISFMAAYAKWGEQAPIVKILNDSLFNGRIGLAYRSLLVYPITLFGKPLDTSIWNEWQYYSLDNGQIMVLLEYGIIGFAGYFWVIQKTLSYIKQEKETVFAIVMIVFLIWSMYEGTMYFIGKNFAFLFLGTIDLNKVSNTKKKHEVENI